MNKKGMINTIIGVIVGTILIVLVAIPVTNSAITSANLTGTTHLIVENIPTFLAISGLVLAAGMMGTSR